MFRCLLILPVLLVAMFLIFYQAAYAQDDPPVDDQPIDMLENVVQPDQCNPSCLIFELQDYCHSGAVPQQYSNQHYTAQIVTNYTRERFIPYSGLYYPNGRLYSFFETSNPPAYTCIRWKANDGPWAGQWSGWRCGNLGSGQYLVLTSIREDMTC